MKKKILPIVLLLFMALMLTACIKNDSSDDYSYYGDAAVTEFSLGTVNRYLLGVRNSTGVKDSLYKTTYSGSDYVFYIDQLQGLIYNPDSLPYGSDASHILATITSKNNGSIGIKEHDDETFYYYSSSDSIDFSQPCTVRILSQNGENQKDYTVKVNVHQQEGDVFNWTQSATQSDLASASKFKLQATLNNVYLVVLNAAGDKTLVYDMTKRLADSSASPIYEMGAAAYESTATIGNQFFMTDGTTLYIFTNGEMTRSETIGSHVKRLIGSSGLRLYALSTDGRLLSSKDDGASWITETFEDDFSYVPTENLNVSWNTMRGDASNEQTIFAGTSSNFSRMLVWTRIEDTADEQTTNWNYVDLSGDYRYAAPVLTGLKVLPYDSGYLAFGMKDNAYSLLQSKDSGITWKKNSLYSYPSDFDQTSSVFAITVDNEKYIWLIDRSGKLWKGRLNRLGWSAK